MIKMKIRRFFEKKKISSDWSKNIIIYLIQFKFFKIIYAKFRKGVRKQIEILKIRYPCEMN